MANNYYINFLCSSNSRPLYLRFKLGLGGSLGVHSSDAYVTQRQPAHDLDPQAGTAGPHQLSVGWGGRGRYCESVGAGLWLAVHEI